MLRKYRAFRETKPGWYAYLTGLASSGTVSAIVWLSEASVGPMALLAVIAFGVMAFLLAWALRAWYRERQKFEQAERSAQVRWKHYEEHQKRLAMDLIADYQQMMEEGTAVEAFHRRMGRMSLTMALTMPKHLQRTDSPIWSAHTGIHYVATNQGDLGDYRESILGLARDLGIEQLLKPPADPPSSKASTRRTADCLATCDGDVESS